MKDLESTESTIQVISSNDFVFLVLDIKRKNTMYLAINRSLS